jgi:hypothetical protein
MNWTLFANSARSQQRRVPSPKVGCRPNLEALEERTVLSPVDFLEVQNQSPLALSGTIAGMNIQQQGANSLTTTYFGDFRADIDEANGTIRFIGTGNDFCAANTGNWAPLANGDSGTATAIYGLQADVGGMAWLAALRDFHLRADTFGSALALHQNADGSFGFSSAETITINAGSGTYSHPTLGHGSVNLSGLQAQNQAGDGTLVDNGSSLHLTVPIDMTVNTTIAGLAATLHIQGTIVGSATIPVVHLGSGSNPNNYATSVVATQGPVYITDPAATVTDASSGTNLTSLTATLTNHLDGAQEFLAVNVGGTGLTASYDASAGVETISGSAVPAVYQSVLRTLTYEDDALTPDTHDRVINVTVSAGGNASVLRTSTVTVFAPARSFTVTDFPLTTTAGAPGSVTVTAQDANGNTAPGYTGRVHFTSSDVQAGLPADYTFTANDHGVHTFTNVVLKTATTFTLQSITAIDTTDNSIQGRQTGIAVSPAAADHFAVTTSAASPDVAGTAFDVTVTVQDAYNNTVSGYTGTVHFSSADPYGAILPTDYTFQSSDAGVAIFSAGATLYTAGTWDVTATAAGSGIAGSANVTVVAAAADHLVFLQPPSDTAAGQTISPAVTVVVVDQFGNGVTTDNTDMLTLSIGTNPSGGTLSALSGNLTVTVVNGVATFSDLSIDLAGMGYSLHATLGGAVPDIDSNPFNIL